MQSTNDTIAFPDTISERLMPTIEMINLQVWLKQFYMIYILHSVYCGFRIPQSFDTAMSLL